METTKLSPLSTAQTAHGGRASVSQGSSNQGKSTSKVRNLEQASIQTA